MVLGSGFKWRLLRLRDVATEGRLADLNECAFDNGDYVVGIDEGHAEGLAQQ